MNEREKLTSVIVFIWKGIFLQLFNMSLYSCGILI